MSCPACGRERRNDKTMGATIDVSGRGVAHCFRCEFTETYSPDRGNFNLHRSAPQRIAVDIPAKRETLSDAGRALWRSAHPIIPKTIAAYYLIARSCVLPPESGHLRWLPAHRHPSGHVGPCLIALLTDVATAAHTSLHFTWIQPDGRKADLDAPRLLLKDHTSGGKVCRLWPDEFVTHGLAIAEGIETALSLAHAYSPIWACINAGNIAKFPVLPGIETLVIGCDRDPAGEKAARACAARWAAVADVLVTNQTANDLNDVAQGVTA